MADLKAYLICAIVLLLHGIRYSTCCSEEEYFECYKNTPDYIHEVDENSTREDLDEFCLNSIEEIQCKVKFCERCPDVYYCSFTEREERRINTMCEEPVKTIYFDNIACLMKIKLDVLEEYCGERPIWRHESCKELLEYIGCVNVTMVNTCGEDAANAFFKIHDPSYELQEIKCE